MLSHTVIGNIRKPKFCCISISNECFMRCKMCSIWKNPVTSSADGVSINEIKNFLISLRSFIDSSLEVNFAGGEPFVEYKGILELIKFANELGFITSVASNAFLIDKTMAQRIKDAGLKTIAISLDSLDENKHDYFRGREGTLQKAIEAIKNLKSIYPEIEIGIQTIIMDMNIDEIIPLVHWTVTNDDLTYIHFQAIIQPMGDPIIDKWYENHNYKELWPQNITKVNRMLDQLVGLREAGSNNPYKIANPPSQLKMYKDYFNNPREFIKKRKTCSTIDFAVNINPLGLVYLCMLMDPIGNIKQKMSDVWYSKEAQMVREKIAACDMNCNSVVNCNYED